MTDTKKYADIPEISDKDISKYTPEEYTYIINAEKYQQTGELEVKRVLRADLAPYARASYVFFKREGCQGYPLVEKDLYLKSPPDRRSNIYVGPFQMDNNACNTFLKHTRKTHPEWKKYAQGSGIVGYMNFVKNCPDKEALLKYIEEYALSDFFNGLESSPKAIAARLATRFNKVDENGEPNATRLPLHVIASIPTGIIARGNGGKFLNKIPTLNDQNIDDYCKTWLSDPNRAEPAYNKLKQIDYLTPEIIAQYQTMGLAGADKLQQDFQTIIAQKESLTRIDGDFLKQDMEDLKTEFLNSPNEFSERQARLDLAVDNRNLQDTPTTKKTPQHPNVSYLRLQLGRD